MFEETTLTKQLGVVNSEGSQSAMWVTFYSCALTGTDGVRHRADPRLDFSPERFDEETEGQGAAQGGT